MWSTLFVVSAVLIFIFIFKPQVRDILIAIARAGNKAKIQYQGWNIDLSGGETPSSIGQHDLKQYELVKEFQSKIVTIEEKFIRDRLIEAKTTPEQAINVLINHLANSRLNVTMLIINNLIYNEQIELLMFLNIQNNPCPETKLYPYFETFKKRTKEESYRFDSFLNFLLQKRLITQNIEGYNISEIGKEYLSFLIKIGRPLSSENVSVESNDSNENEPEKATREKSTEKE